MMHANYFKQQSEYHTRPANVEGLYNETTLKFCTNRSIHYAETETISSASKCIVDSSNAIQCMKEYQT